MSSLLQEFAFDRRAADFRPSGMTASECVEVSDFVDSMRMLGSAVAVVTTFVDEKPWGLTISSMSSFSADPARITLSLKKANVTASYIAEHEKFGLSILAAAHAPLAAALARPGQPKFLPDADLAADVGSAHGMPAIAGALFNLECQVAFFVEAIDHILIVADVVSSRGDGAEQARKPLMHFNRAFGSFRVEEMSKESA